MHRLIAPAGAIALSIGDIFKDGRDRILHCVLRQPEPRGKPATVAQFDPDIFFDFD
jgi:hypothetical protein